MGDNLTSSERLPGIFIPASLLPLQQPPQQPAPPAVLSSVNSASYRASQKLAGSTYTSNDQRTPHRVTGGYAVSKQQQLQPAAVAIPATAIVTKPAAPATPVAGSSLALAAVRARLAALPANQQTWQLRVTPPNVSSPVTDILHDAAVTISTTQPPTLQFHLPRSSSAVVPLVQTYSFQLQLLTHGAPSLTAQVTQIAAAGDQLLVQATVEDTAPATTNSTITNSSIRLPISNAQPTQPRRIHLNAFDMVCISHMSHGLWRHPADRAQTYTDIEYWTNLAQLLERGSFDSIFLADVLGTYDIYNGSRDAAVRNAMQTPVLDPTYVIPAMATATKRLGFGVTVSTTYELPYSFARSMSTLDHLTKGRVAWNIVTSYLESAAVNLGLDTQIPHDERYDIAEEFLQVCYKLWEGSWTDKAVLRDAKSGVWADASQVRDINHSGKYYTVPGCHLVEPSPQRTPVLFQAGSSGKGKAFGGRNAEAIFVSGDQPATVRKNVDDIRRIAAEAGRDPRSIKVYTKMATIVAPTEAEAQAKYEEYKSYMSVEAALAFFGSSGIDLSGVPLDQPLKEIVTDLNRERLARFVNDPHKVWTPRKLAEMIAIGGAGPLLVGTPQKIADELERWQLEADVDGFNLAYVITPGTFEDFVNLVVPELRRRGRVASEHEMLDGPATLRERLGGAGVGPKLPDTHPGAQFRSL